MRLYHFLSDLIYALDVLYATVGYVLSFRVLDTHLRSAEPTMLGWVVALECYKPFWSELFSRLYLHYEGIGFEAWLARARLAAVGLGGRHPRAARASTCWRRSRSACASRTSRTAGILTNGPYRYTQAPGVRREEPLVVAHHAAVHPAPRVGERDQEHAGPGGREHHLLPARADRGAAPVAGPDVRASTRCG